MEAVLSEEVSDELGFRRILKETVHISDASGQLYLEPDVSLEGWIASLPADIANEQQVMALCSYHAISEQFYSEFKTDLDLECLPSGKLHTNNLAIAFATMVYNLLRWMGQRLTGPNAPPSRTPSPKDDDARTHLHGAPTNSQRPTMAAAIWPTLSGFCHLSGPLSRSCLFRISHSNIPSPLTHPAP
ncbi:conserved hypothetical protein [Marinobacter salarius]|jgi:hypothetical protein|uniref:Transposase DDE domain-containing protein n=1 Tax=Marinobacter algicola DG893 TaxID=443152 RepID=A6EWM9_9GAMM|nr:hypothetical protein MDG893_08460 [Marinobacter algicola DG893]VVS97515.1 conserved hypothetical protein [Marinobacter salarius]VXC45123.1 conserved hypothetical protein [Marinobacter salarius]